MATTSFDGTTNGIIERLINLMYSSPNRIYTVTELKNLDLDYIFNPNYNFDRSIKIMQAMKIITVDLSSYCWLEQLGYEIHYQGGWKAYLKHEEHKRELVARNYKWFWGVVGLSVLSAFFSGYSTYTKTQNISEVELRLSKVENQLQQLQQKPSPYRLPLPTHPSAKFERGK